VRNAQTKARTQCEENSFVLHKSDGKGEKNRGQKSSYHHSLETKGELRRGEEAETGARDAGDIGNQLSPGRKKT